MLRKEANNLVLQCLDLFIADLETAIQESVSEQRVLAAELKKRRKMLDTIVANRNNYISGEAVDE